MRQPNRAIERERHITPTIDDIINQLNRSYVFSKLDLTSGYHQSILMYNHVTLQHSQHILVYVDINV